MQEASFYQGRPNLRYRSAGTLFLALAAATALAADTLLPPEDTGDVYVSSYGTNDVHCYSPAGAFLFRFGHPDLKGTRGLAFSPGRELHVSSQSNDRILVFTGEGTYLRQFAGGGLTGPTSLAFGPDEKLYVSSFGTDEVLVFGDGAFERKFTAAGLRGPNCIAFGPSGEIYVASQATNEVFQFDAAGGYVRKFTGGGLSSPMGIAVYGDEVFVTGGSSHDVVVFDLVGSFRREIAGSGSDPVLNGPQGIAFDDAGNFAVSSFYTGKVGLYAPDGTRIRVFDESGIRTARSVAYLPLSRPRAFLRGDANLDGRLDLSDPVAVLERLFLGAPASPCEDAADSNDDGLLDITDAIFTLGFLFLGGPAPAAPFPAAGLDSTPDGLLCP